MAACSPLFSPGGTVPIAATRGSGDPRQEGICEHVLDGLHHACKQVPVALCYCIFWQPEGTRTWIRKICTQAFLLICHAAPMLK